MEIDARDGRPWDAMLHACTHAQPAGALKTCLASLINSSVLLVSGRVKCKESPYAPKTLFYFTGSPYCAMRFLITCDATQSTLREYNNQTPPASDVLVGSPSFPCGSWAPKPTSKTHQVFPSGFANSYPACELEFRLNNQRIQSSPISDVTPSHETLHCIRESESIRLIRMMIA